MEMVLSRHLFKKKAAPGMLIGEAFSLGLAPAACREAAPTTLAGRNGFEDRFVCGEVGQGPKGIHRPPGCPGGSPSAAPLSGKRLLLALLAPRRCGS